MQCNSNIKQNKVIVIQYCTALSALSCLISMHTVDLQQGVMLQPQPGLRITKASLSPKTRPAMCKISLSVCLSVCLFL